MGILNINPLLNIQDKYIEMYNINSYRFGDTTPIMSFQTNKNGVFNPSLAIASGNLKWNINGVDYITNSPSVGLNGSLVDVKVYAHTVPVNSVVTSVSFSSQNIIGILNFSRFRITGSVWLNSNPSLTSVIFSTNANTSSSFLAHTTGLTSLNLSSFTLTGSVQLYSNPSLTSVIFSTNANTSNSFSIYTTGLTSLNLSSFTLTGPVWLNSNPSLTSVIFSTNANTSNSFLAHTTGLTSLNLSSFTFTGSVWLNSNPSLTSVIFSTNANTSNSFSIYTTGLTSLNLSSFTFTGSVWLNSNPSLTTVTTGSYTTGLSLYDVKNCALTLTTVDNIYVSIYNYFNVSTPTRNLTVNTSGTVNADPSSIGATAITNTQAKFTAAGFIYTAVI